MIRIVTNFKTIFAVAASCAALSASADTLLVVGQIPVSSGDATTISHLELLGHAVTVVKDSASTAASADGKNLVIISDSVAHASVGNKFNQVTVPVIVYEPWLYDNLGLTGVVAGTDYGLAYNQTKLRMTGTHPLTGRLTGVVTVGSAASRFSWGRPAAAAVVAATQTSDATRPMIFAYEAGALLANGTLAPARRVALFPNTGATNTWSANGQYLFIKAVQWARNDPPPAAIVRILPLGDSITRGSNSHWTYRRNLEGALAGDNCSFDMVGSMFGPASGPGYPLLDRDHEGHSGLRTDQIRARLSNWLPGNEPDWALVHVGTNDVLQGTSITAARANISTIINKLRNANPNVGILLAQVIPNLPANEAAVAALNDAIVSLAAEKNLPAVSPVIAVDQYSGYNTFTHNYDQIHPNDAGEAMMAERWFQALRPMIADFCGFTPPMLLAGTIGLINTGQRIAEAKATVVYTVRRTGGSDGSVSVDYATVPGQALTGSDFQDASGTLSWDDGDSSDRIITINLIDDAVFEPEEDFSLTLFAPTGGAELAASQAVTDIVSDDVASGGGGGAISAWSLVFVYGFAFAGHVQRRRKYLAQT